ncbi:hypothetical protein BD779DRAFT_1666720 [Infundibulicybe gibba]|nr:hypothetical protein BD779DRAFT_1666720 [Infundibulicybe gibba]
MNDMPYTTPDEDPFNVQPLLQQPRRRRSSMLSKWIQEQQKQPSAQNDASDDLSPSNCDFGLVTTSSEDILTVNSYDLVEDDDIPLEMPKSGPPETPTISRSRRSSKILHSPTSFRNFHLNFRSSSPAALDSPRPSSRISLFPRTPSSSSASVKRTSQQSHGRSPSLSTLNIADSPQQSPIAGSSKWRPSVMGHFSSAASQASEPPSESMYSPSRPSVSSGETYATTTTSTTVLDNECPLPPPKISFMDSIRSRSPSSMFRSSTISSATHIPWAHENIESTGALKSDSRASSTIDGCVDTVRTPLSPKPQSRLQNSNIDSDDDEPPPLKFDPTKPHVAYAAANLPRVTFASLSGRNQKKKKKLVVSGVGIRDVRKFEGIKRWCESFGEVSQITRMPNGDLHVHFRRADVADTVCRVRAKVTIAGVGSVQLSWFCGDKR